MGQSMLKQVSLYTFYTTEMQAYVDLSCVIRASWVSDESPVTTLIYWARKRDNTITGRIQDFSRGDRSRRRRFSLTARLPADIQTDLNYGPPPHGRKAATRLRLNPLLTNRINNS
jgi:hypothetical protein